VSRSEIPLSGIPSGRISRLRAPGWRAGALPGAILGIVCGLSVNAFSPWLLAFPALACGWWAAARLPDGPPAGVGDRMSAAGVSGLVAAAIVEAGGTLGAFWSYSSSVRGGSTPWDSGVLGLPFVPLMMLIPAGLTLACTVLGGLVSAAAAARRR